MSSLAPDHCSGISSDTARGAVGPTHFDLKLFFSAILLPFFITRLILLAVALTAFYELPSARAADWNSPTSSNALNIASRFDGKWYLSIARDGYFWDAHHQNNVAFAPLYPMLMRLGGRLSGGSIAAYLITGLIISNLSLIIGLAYIVALLLRDGRDRITASRACWYILLFPTSFFLSVVYPMSLIMALAAAALYHARKKQWEIVGVLAAMAALSRPDGVLLSAALAVEYYLQYGLTLRKELITFIAAPLATLSWMLFQWRQFGSPLAFVSAQKWWSSCPLTTVLHSSQGVLILILASLFVLLSAAAVFKLRPSQSVFSIMMLGVMLWANRYWSIMRLLLVLFPAFMMLAIALRPYKRLHKVYCCLSSLVSLLLIVRFALNLWVA